MANQSNNWTHAELQQLFLMLAEGYRYTEIALKLGRTESALHGMLHRFMKRECYAPYHAALEAALAERAKHPLKFHWTPAADNQLMALRDQGYDDQAIAERMGASRIAIKNRRHLLRQRAAPPERADTSERRLMDLALFGLRKAA